MSAEHLKSHHESSENKEIDKDLVKEQEKKLERQIQEAEKTKENTADKSIDQIRDSIENTAKSKNEKVLTEQDDNKKVPAPRLDRSVKNAAYKKELSRIRKHLSGPEKSFSKVIHNPTMEKINSVGSKTVARPSGLLGGGIFAFLGTLLIYIMSRYYGFEYNFFFFLGLMAAGFFIGLCVEILVYPLIKRSKS